MCVCVVVECDWEEIYWFKAPKMSTMKLNHNFLSTGWQALVDNACIYICVCVLDIHMCVYTYTQTHVWERLQVKFLKRPSRARLQLQSGSFVELTLPLSLQQVGVAEGLYLCLKSVNDMNVYLRNQENKKIVF